MARTRRLSGTTWPDGTTQDTAPAGGGGGASGAELTATTDHTTTNPALPTSGLRLFSRFRARRLPAFVGPLGQDSQLQPALFSNRVVMWNAVNNLSTPTTFGATFTNIGTASLIKSESTNFYTAMVRQRFASTTTAGNAGGLRTSSAQWFLSSTANLGGFFFVARLGFNQVTATNRIFIGLHSAEANVAGTVEPKSLTNTIGFGCNAAETTLRVFSNDATGTATQHADLGATFPATGGAATNFYEFRLFAPSAAGQQVYWSAHRLNDGLVVNGGPVTTDLPALGTLLATHILHSNGTTAAAVHVDVQSLYIESDN